MIIVSKVSELQKHLAGRDLKSTSVGFVPTMGALHEGHLALARRSLKENTFTVCSIFVNPTQFNDKKDLEKYPRTLEKDCALLEEIGVDFVFAPSTDEIYPENLKMEIPDLNGLDQVLEGAHRPGHFQGVVQVVLRLLDIVRPDRLYMGQKDFQQFTIIRHVLRVTKSPVALIVCKTKREKNGLAMSSRNQRLSEDMKNKAGLIYKTLTAVKRNLGKKSVEELIQYAIRRLSTEYFTVEYIAITDGNTLQPVSEYKPGQYVVISLALWAEGVRLIDNVILSEQSQEAGNATK
jgi:pantoate--beta-alanine ligase